MIFFYRKEKLIESKVPEQYWENDSVWGYGTNERPNRILYDSNNCFVYYLDSMDWVGLDWKLPKGDEKRNNFEMLVDGLSMAYGYDYMTGEEMGRGIKTTINDNITPGGYDSNNSNDVEMIDKNNITHNNNNNKVISRQLSNMFTNE